MPSLRIFAHLITGLLLIFVSSGTAGGPTNPSAPVPAPSALPAVLDLTTAQQIALKANPSLAAAGERVVQAAQRLRQSQAAWWPRIDATALGSRNWQAESDREIQLQTARLFDPGAAIDDPEDFYRTGLSATWLLFDGFARKYRIAGARFGLDESSYARDDAQRLLLTAVAEAFYNAQLLKEGIHIAEADEEFNQRQVVEAEARYRVGTGSWSDVLNFKVQVNSAKSSVIQARQAYEVALYGLVALMGYAGGAFPQTVTLAELTPATAAELAQPAVIPLIEASFAQRPDIQQQINLVARTGTEIKQAQGAFWPQIDAFGRVEGERSEDTAFEGDDFGNALGFNLTYNLFAGGQDRAQVDEIRSRRNEAEDLLASLRNDVAAEIRQILAQLTSARDRLRLEQQNAELVKENRDLVETEYAAGQASLVRLNDAQRQLTQANVRLAQARVALRQAWVRLDAATGAILTDFRTLSGVP